MIRDSLSCIPDSKTRIPDSTSKNFSDSAIRIPLLFLFENHSITMSLLFVCLFVCSLQDVSLAHVFLTFINQISPHVRYMISGILEFFLFWIPESAKFLLVGSEILDFGISGLSQGIRNPANDWNLQSKFHGKGIRNSITRTRNKQRGIQNPVLNYLTWSV